MEDFEEKKKIKSKISKIKREIIRLTELLKNKGIDGDKLKIAEELIKDIAFMTVESAELKEQVQIFGATEEYQNGANQRGRKRSASFDAYLNLTKQKAALIKQLTELLPESDDIPYIPNEEENDGFDDFLKFREHKNDEPDNRVLQ